MSDLRTAAQQALEALETLVPRRGGDEYSRAAAALRAALAQQAEPVQMHPSQFAELIKGKETMIGVPVYWAEWPSKEKQ